MFTGLEREPRFNHLCPAARDYVNATRSDGYRWANPLLVEVPEGETCPFCGKEGGDWSE
jgi:hypothetical protein